MPDDFADLRQFADGRDDPQMPTLSVRPSALQDLLYAYDTLKRAVKVQVRLNLLDQELIVYLEAENERLKTFASGSKSADE